MHENRYYLGAGDLGSAYRTAGEILDLALEGSRYLQTYDWLLLCSIITLGYLGSILFGIAVLLREYVLLAPPQIARLAKRDEKLAAAGRATAGQWICLPAFAILATKFLIERTPITYHLYAAFAAYLWARVIDERHVFAASFQLAGGNFSAVLRIALALIGTLLLLEFIVLGYLVRLAWTAGFLFIGIVWPLVAIPASFRRANVRTIALWTATCLITSVFTVSSLDKTESIPIL